MMRLLRALHALERVYVKPLTAPTYVHEKIGSLFFKILGEKTATEVVV